MRLSILSTVFHASQTLYISLGSAPLHRIHSLQSKLHGRNHGVAAVQFLQGSEHTWCATVAIGGQEVLLAVDPGSPFL